MKVLGPLCYNRNMEHKKLANAQFVGIATVLVWCVVQVAKERCKSARFWGTKRS